MAVYIGSIASLAAKELTTRQQDVQSGVMGLSATKELLTRSRITNAPAGKVELRAKELLTRVVNYQPGKILIYDKGFNTPRKSPNEIVWILANSQ